MRRLDLNYVKERFLEKHIQIIDDNYLNSRLKLRCRCLICGNLFLKSWDKFKRGQGCVKCGRERSHVKQMLSYEYVKNYLRELNITLLDDEYNGSHKKLRCKCNKCQNVFLKEWTNLQQGQGCIWCSRDRLSKMFSRENGHWWIEDRELAKKIRKFNRKCHNAIRRMLKHASDGKTKHPTEDMLGYKIEDLINHLESKFDFDVDGDWSLDHIFPIKAFVDYNLFDVKLANCLENLQILPLRDNIRKQAKYNSKKFERWLQEKGIMCTK